MPHILMIATGGTIACCETERGLSPALDSAALLGALPELSALCTVETLDLMQLDSTDVTAADRQRMAQAVWQNREKFDGFVLTHGTDTLEETAYLLDLVHNSEKPVCLTGAMRSAAEISPDGPVNLLCAVRTAASSEARGKGVLVVMNEEIHAAREVVKSHSANTETFVSPFWGPLGYVDPDRVVFRRNTLGRQSIRPPELVEDVHLIKLASGSDSLLIDFLVERNVRGLVLEAFGRGNVPPAALPGGESTSSSSLSSMVLKKTPVSGESSS